jgi:antitoxin MazE
MRSKIVRIGNSRGIRIPKALLEHAHLRDSVDIDVEDGALVVRCADSPRAGWDAAFERMAAAGDDALLDAGRLPRTKFDESEWEWK